MTTTDRRRPEPSRLGRLARASALVALTAIPGAALAHSGGAGDGPATGLPIPPIPHGEMALVDERLDEIVALARRQAATDGQMRRLYNHYGVQFAYCLWGLAPGGVTREDSPFNPCAHAYLAAAKQLLVVMSREPASARPARAILGRLEARRRETPAASELCSSSGESFNTASLVRPSLSDVVRDPAVAVIGLGAMLVLAGGAAAARSLGPVSHRADPRPD